MSSHYGTNNANTIEGPVYGSASTCERRRDTALFQCRCWSAQLFFVAALADLLAGRDRVALRGSRVASDFLSTSILRLTVRF